MKAIVIIKRLICGFQVSGVTCQDILTRMKLPRQRFLLDQAMLTRSSVAVLKTESRHEAGKPGTNNINRLGKGAYDNCSLQPRKKI